MMQEIPSLAQILYMVALLGSLGTLIAVGILVGHFRKHLD